MASEKIDALELDISAKFTTENLDKLITALGKLSKALDDVNGKRVKEEIDKTGDSADDASKKVDTLTNSFVTQAVKITALIAVFRKLSDVVSDGIANSMQYIENLNMFTVSLGKYSTNAQKYAETVSDVMGIDYSEWEHTQGVFDTLIEGFGVSGEKAAYMSQNLTQLTYDLASFYNLSFSEAERKVQSAVAGELEPVRRLGYDLSQAKLTAIAQNPANYAQTTYAINAETGAIEANNEAWEENVERQIANFNELTQAEKVQLRYIALMTQVTDVQGDMGRTLKDPANQMRIFREQLSMTSRALGNVFIPMLNQVLPYLTAFFDILEDGLQEIAAFFGYELPDMSSRMDVSDDVPYYENIVEATGAAARNAKKIKDYTIGLDELNVLRPDDGTSGGGGSTPNYGSLADGLYTPGYDFLSKAIENSLENARSQIEGFFSYWRSQSLPEIAVNLVHGAGLVGQGFWEWALGKSPEELAYEANVHGRTIGEEFWYALMHNPNGYGVDLWTWITGKTPEQLKAESEYWGGSVGWAFMDALIPTLSDAKAFGNALGEWLKNADKRAQSAGRSFAEQFMLEFGQRCLQIIEDNPALSELYKIATGRDVSEVLEMYNRALRTKYRTYSDLPTKPEAHKSYSNTSAEEARKHGEEVAKAYADGMESATDEVERSAKRVYEKAFDGATNNGNGSRWFYNASSEESSRYADGIRSGTSLAASAGQALYDSAFNGVSKGGSGAKNFYDNGKQSGTAYNNGLIENLATLLSTGTKLFDAAYEGVSKGGSASTVFSNTGYYASAAYNNGLLSNMRDVLASGGKLFNGAYNGANNNGNASNDFKAIADNLAKMFTTALGSESAKNNAYNAGSSLSKKGAEGTKAYKNDYSYVAAELATLFANSMASSSMLKKVYDAGAEIANEGSWGTTAYNDDYEYTGEMAGTGFINGMRECLDDAYNAGTDLGRTVLNRMAEVLDVGSPSKEAAKIGMWTSIGYAKGIEEYTKSATEAAGRMAQLSLQAADSFITDRQISVPASNMGYGIGVANEGAMANLASNIYQAVVSGMSVYGGDNGKEVNIIIDGKEVFKVVQSESIKRGAKISNGAFSR